MKDKVGREIINKKVRDAFLQEYDWEWTRDTMKDRGFKVMEFLKKNDPADWACFNDVVCAFRNIDNALAFPEPYAVCVYCGGDGCDGDCKACRGQGWMPKQVYDRVPAEMKG